MATNKNHLELATVDENGEAFGLVGLVAGTSAYQMVTDDYIVTFGVDADTGKFVCEVDDAHDYTCLSCVWQEELNDALYQAAVGAAAWDAMDESDNCEDAVNLAAYKALGVLGEQSMPETKFEWERYDALLGYAAAIVKRDCHKHGYEWEEYSF